MVPGPWALNAMLRTLQGETDPGCGLGLRLLFETQGSKLPQQGKPLPGNWMLGKEQELFQAFAET